MTQYELEQQFIQYAENNLQDDTTLRGVITLLGNMASKLYNEGYTKEANRLSTAELIIQEVLHSEK